MPNWCSTVIKFYSENREQLEAMHKKFNEIRNGKPTVKNDFNNGFMGDYANTYLPELGHEKVECRGWVDGIDEIEHNDKHDVFTVWTETAWGAKMGMWAEIVKRFYPDVHSAEEARKMGNEYIRAWDLRNETVRRVRLMSQEEWQERKSNQNEYNGGGFQRFRKEVQNA